jgi:hypothetical protein
MSKTLFPFVWRVAKSGYFWTLPAEGLPLPTPHVGESSWRNALERAGESLPVLTDGIPVHTSSADRLRRSYRPLQDQTGLFRTFADTPLNQDGVIAFARKYGLLGLSETTMVDVAFDGSTGRRTRANGETLTAWQAEIAAMRHVTRLWDLSEARNADALREFIRWNDDGVFYVNGEVVEPITLDPKGDRVRDVVLAARVFIERKINRRLSGFVSPRVLLSPPKGQRGLYFVPESLIGALWFQFGRSASGGKEIRRCRCGKWFEVSLEKHAFTARRLYCDDKSGKCRAQAYRQRIDDARSLRAEGVRVSQIAKRLGTNPAQVKAWLNPKPRKQRET